MKGKNKNSKKSQVNHIAIRACCIRTLLFISLFFHGFTSFAQEPLEEEKGWDFIVAPYVLFPSMNGNVAVKGIPVDVSVNAGDIFSNLDFGAMLYFEARNDKWAITFDGLYMDLSKKGVTPVLERDLKAEVSQLGLTMMGMYRLNSWAEVGIGGRLNSIGSKLDIAPGEIVLPGQDFSMNNTWFDPLIVARAMTRFNEDKWRLGLFVDLGGFGVGSDFAWEIHPFAGYQFSELFEMALAYRWLDMKYETGSGSTQFLYDMTTSGPELGFVFHF